MVDLNSEAASQGIRIPADAASLRQKNVDGGQSQETPPSSSSRYIRGIDDEEKAKEIAIEDLQASRKQVGSLSTPLPLSPFLCRFCYGCYGTTITFCHHNLI